MLNGPDCSTLGVSMLNDMTGSWGTLTPMLNGPDCSTLGVPMLNGMTLNTGVLWVSHLIVIWKAPAICSRMLKQIKHSKLNTGALDINWTEHREFRMLIGLFPNGCLVLKHSVG